ncbi:poly [ADP-ribose] polymerase 2 isoform X2 [Equus quagga]|uniref:poly [ADP-ribose] polymerase 2 isoform X2 n=1 Tax=Equus quagga TaxID=89248 RepID=UPI001EE38937|nr:poly [ADP-ribose] polymerase 2 isoform X2 [Equus quagga]
MAARRRLRGRNSSRPGASVALNETERVNNGHTATKDPPPAKKSRRCPRQGVKKEPVAGGKTDKEKAEDKQESVKTLLLKGKVPVDPECTAKVGKAHVYCERNDVYDAMLNQTNLQFNNNKYYVIQLLEDDAQRNFSVWMRWGRVGKVGQHSLVACSGDLNKAKEIFQKKFLDKTKNNWEGREKFEKVPGKYDMLQMDYSTTIQSEEETKKEESLKSPLKPESQLDLRVQELIKLICNVQAMEEMMVEMKYDAKKAPLGKLTVAQIKAGYQSLKKIEDCIRAGQHGRALTEACNEFYTRIPHDFGLRTPPLIRTEKELSEKVQLLEALGDIEIAMKLVKTELQSPEHPLDQHYRKLHCALRPLDRDSYEFKFGKGIYFADMSSKSANYCFASHLKDTGLLLLSEVALGQCNELLEANPEAEGLLQGKHSTKGLGKMAPSPACFTTLNGSTVPLGPASETGILNPEGYTLNYNEFIVYSPNQVRMRYLLKIRFNFLQLW